MKDKFPSKPMQLAWWEQTSSSAPRETVFQTEKMKASVPLYLTPLHNFQADRDVWFSSAPVGLSG